MEAKAGDLLPRHKASKESVLIVIKVEINIQQPTEINKQKRTPI